MATDNGYYQPGDPFNDALRDYYDYALEKSIPKYVGQGKRFASVKEFKDYMGGVGQGLAETFQGGAYHDQDPELQRLAKIGRTAYATYGMVDKNNAHNLVAGDPEFKQFYDKHNPDPAKAGEDAAAIEQASFDRKRKDIIAKVQAFADEMGMPVSELMKNDDFAKELSKATMGGQMTEAANRGLGLGGISMANADEATKRALIGYQSQRQQAGQNALSNAYNMISGMKGESTALERYNQNLDLQMQQARAAAEQQQAAQRAQMLGTLGSVAGGAIGYGLGGTQGASFGSQLGGGLGSVAGTAGYKPYQYTYPSTKTGGSGGGVGGVKYGGNY